MIEKFFKMARMASMASENPIALVVLAGVPETEVQKLKSSVESTEFEFVGVPDVKALLEKVEDPRCFAVVFCDTLYRDLLGIMAEGSSLSAARWFLYTENKTNTFRFQAEAAGAAMVLPYPVVAAQIVLRVRQSFGKEKEKYYATYRDKMGSQLPPSKKLGVVPLDPTVDYQDRRSWPSLFGVELSKFGLLFDDRLGAFEEILRKVLLDIKGEGRLSLIVLDDSMAIDHEVPKTHRVLASSDALPSVGYVRESARYPEIKLALMQAAAIVVPDVSLARDFDGIHLFLQGIGVQSVAVIPVFSDNKIIAIFMLRHKEVMTDATKKFLQDFSGYASELGEFVKYLDYFGRVYGLSKDR